MKASRINSGKERSVMPLLCRYPRLTGAAALLLTAAGSFKLFVYEDYRGGALLLISAFALATLFLRSRVFAAAAVEGDSRSEERLSSLRSELASFKEKEAKQHHHDYMNRALKTLYDRAYEFDLTHDSILRGAEFFQKSGCGTASLTEAIKDCAEKRVHPDDKEKYLQFSLPANIRQRFLKGQSKFSLEYRTLTDEPDKYRWKSAAATTFMDTETASLLSVWFLRDITEECEQREMLRELADRDSLTGLLNKKSTEERITASLEELGPVEGTGCLIMLDLDNFKKINDMMGHIFGDAVLSSVAQLLRATYGECPVGRVGGDEFMVFVRSCNEEELSARLGAFTEAICAMHRSSSSSFRMSVSTGASRFPQDRTTFKELYKKADTALYSVKQEGKNKFRFYEPSMEGTVLGENRLTAWDMNCEDDNMAYFADNPAPAAFRILYNAQDRKLAVKAVIEQIVRHFSLSRGYIFENSPDETLYTEVYEFCNDGVTPSISRFQNRSYATDRPDYFSNFDSRGIFWMETKVTPEPLKTVFKAQGITSLLQVALIIRGKFRGFIGFDCCDKDRSLTSAEKSVLSVSAQIIASFAAQEIENKMLLRRINGIHMTIYSLELPACVVNTDTSEVIFVNKKMKELLGDIHCGSKCWKAIFDREEPCESCPLKQAAAGEAGKSILFMPKIQKWYQISVIPIEWETDNASLLLGYEVTSFMKDKAAPAPERHKTEPSKSQKVS